MIWFSAHQYRQVCYLMVTAAFFERMASKRQMHMLNFPTTIDKVKRKYTKITYDHRPHTNTILSDHVHTFISPSPEGRQNIQLCKILQIYKFSKFAPCFILTKIWPLLIKMYKHTAVRETFKMVFLKSPALSTF